MKEIIISILPYLVLISHVILAFLFVAVIFRRSWGGVVVNFVGRSSLALSVLVTLGLVLGSLFYSEVVGYEACVLCWWQRVLLYPQLLLFIVAWWKKDAGIFVYTVGLTAIASVIALYQSYANWGGASLLPCTAEGGACSKVYVMEFGYITIPAMALTAILYLLLITWINRIYRKNENSNA